MKKILRIARLELSIMFYSPIAWLVLIIFTIQTGLTFTDLLYSQETNQQLGRPLNVLTKVLFAGEDGILAAVQKNLYLYIPLLTMGLLSRETSSGSIKLLLSSPVTVSQIVLGKFLSMMGYTFLLVLILASFIVSGMISIEALDIEFVVGGIFGIYLLMCAYSAIGLFMSSLTSYQVVAAISTLAVLAALNFVGNIGQSHDFIRDITYWLSISGRADTMVNGLLSLKDLMYFLLVIGLFLGLAIIKLRDERKTSSSGIKVARYSFAVLLVVVLGYITSMPTVNAYYDTTRFKDRTLTENSQGIVGNLDKPVEITTYTNAIHYTASYGAPENRISDLSRFEQYRRFLPDMKMDYVVYYDTLVHYNDTTKTLLEKAETATNAHKFDFEEMLTPEQIKERINLIPENNRLVRMVTYDGKTTPLRMFNDIYVYPFEKEITAALTRLTKGAAQVGFLSGNDERSTEKVSNAGYVMITKGVNDRNSLINQGFDVNDIAFQNADDIPTDIDVLVIADPKREYTETQIQKIKDYLQAGGNMMLAGEPGRESFLNPILQEMGLTFEKGTLLQETENFELDLIQAGFTPEASEFGFKFYDEAIVTLPGAMGIAYSDSTDFRITPILVTDANSTWNKLGEFDLEIEKVEFDPETEQRVEVPVAVALERSFPEKTQKIIVLGDADFFSNAEMNRQSPRPMNANYAIRMFKWFTDGEFPVDTSRPAAIDKVIKLSRNEIQWMKGIYSGVIPVVIGGLGMFILIRRKRQ